MIDARAFNGGGSSGLPSLYKKLFQHTSERETKLDFIDLNLIITKIASLSELQYIKPPFYARL